MYKQLGQGPSAYWIPGGSSATATMGVGSYLPTSGVIRGAWECACPTEMPTSRKIPLSGVFDEPKNLMLVGGAALAAWFLLRKPKRRTAGR